MRSRLVPVRPRPSFRFPTAFVAASAMLALGLLGGGSASAATVVSQGRGDVLSGSLLGVDLDSLAALADAVAVNTGGTAVTSVDPLTVTALNTVTLPLGQINIPLTDALHLGVLNQYALASPDGSASAASGAVTNSGAIAISGQNGTQTDSRVDLSQLLPPSVTSTLANLSLDLGAVAATATQAAGANGTQTGSYGIAHLTVGMTSPLVRQTTATLTSSLVALQPVVDGIPALLSVLGPLVQVSGLPDLSALVASLGTVTTADGSMTLDLNTGVLSVDLPALLTGLGLDVNALPANTELVPYLTLALVQDLLPAVTAVLNDLVATISGSILGIKVTVLGVPVSLAVLQPLLQPVITTVTQPIVDLVGSLGTTVLAPLATVLTQVLSLVVNAQSVAAGAFTETALAVAVVPAAPVASLRLASASVGPSTGPLPATTAPTAPGPTAAAPPAPAAPPTSTAPPVTATPGGSPAPGTVPAAATPADPQRLPNTGFNPALAALALLLAAAAAVLRAASTQPARG